MDPESDRIEKVLNILKSCTAPTLLEDIDNNPADSSDFEQYRRIANEQLYLLLDVLYQNRYLISTQAYDNQLIELRTKLLIVACEQLEPNPFFQSDDQLLTSLRKIIFDHVEGFEDAVYEKCLQYYKESLTKDKWKRNIGAVHGFPLFCEIFLRHKVKIANDDVIMFSLSVGSNLISHHDPHYKTIGTKIFRHLISLSDSQRIRHLNIHSVIFNEVLPLIQRSSEVDFNDHIYECLYQVLRIDGCRLKDTNWCKFDDVMEKLITQFSIEGDSNLCKMLLHKIVKFCTINNKNIQITSNELASSSEEYFKNLRSHFREPNHLTARWTKKFMEMMTRESVTMLNNSHNAIFILNSFHSIYVATLFTINPTMLQDQLDEFVKKIVLVFMQVLRANRSNESSKAIKYFLNTIQMHRSENVELVNCLNKVQEKVL